MRTLALLPALLLPLLWAGVAGAADMKGVVTQLDLQRRVISVALEGACECEAVPFIVPADVTLAGITQGATVTVFYTSAGTVNTVTKIAK